MIDIIFWFLLITLLYIYIGNFFFLNILLLFKYKKRNNKKRRDYLSVSIIIAAYNEENYIGKRIENLLSQDYPKDKIEIIVSSDGSTEKTVEIASRFINKNIKVLDFKQNRGRAMIQNAGVKEATGEIVVFTDAETKFDKGFLKNIVRYFSEASVGLIVGNLIYKLKNSSISRSEGFYWKFEKKLRDLESKLGILATASGACMAVRKNLWRDLSPIDDSDFTTPLDVILQGYGVIFAKDAIAFDTPFSSMKEELQARIRQTSKNLIGTLKRWGIKGWFKHPLVSWGLLSHKILRWFTPFFLVGAFISNIFLINNNWFYKFTFATQIAFYLIAIWGIIMGFAKKKFPLASVILDFCIANIGMGIGVVKGLIGRAPTTYKMKK